MNMICNIILSDLSFPNPTLFVLFHKKKDYWKYLIKRKWQVNMAALRKCWTISESSKFDKLVKLLDLARRPRTYFLTHHIVKRMCT